MRYCRFAMVLWIGIDDTDSLRGMCTTFLATEVVRDLTNEFDLIGYPRLVRLNPNVPWKTRGNGAICIPIGKGSGRSFRVGQIDSCSISAYQRSAEDPEPQRVLERIEPIVEKWSDLKAQGTEPGLVVLNRKPRQRLYWKAVRGVVERRVAELEIRKRGVARCWKGGRGLIGAAAACAWRPHNRSWEVLAYREASLWGTRRTLSPDSVQEIDAICNHTFNNYDYDNRRVVIAPRSPCPVLFGVRGFRPGELVRAVRIVRGERPSRWMIFLTNQGTDDHVLRGPTAVPGTAGTFRGKVSRAPRTLPGGHVVFKLGTREVTAYEPSKQFRDAVRRLVPGDLLEVVGSVRNVPRTINLEKFRVLTLAASWAKPSNPECPLCGRHMKSSGRVGPFRCRKCGVRAPKDDLAPAPLSRLIRLGWHAPPAGSRRHLSRPEDVRDGRHIYSRRPGA
jgi:tRNA(Ile2)-agmatinylcytidine synthase